MKENFYTGIFLNIEQKNIKFQLELHRLAFTTGSKWRKSNKVRSYPRTIYRRSKLWGKALVKQFRPSYYLLPGRFGASGSYALFQYEHVNVERIGEGEDAHDEETVFTIKVSSCVIFSWQ